MNLEMLVKEPGQSISQWTYALLNTNIIKLHLTPGSAISEAEIAERLAINRPPSADLSRLWTETDLAASQKNGL